MSMYLEVAEKTTRSTARDNDGLHKRRGIWHYKLKMAGRWKEFSTRTTSYQEARKIRQQAAQDHQQGQLPTDMAKWPFEKAAAQWLALRINHVAPKTSETEKERLQALLKFFSGRRLGDINAVDIRAYQARRVLKV